MSASDFRRDRRAGQALSVTTFTMGPSPSPTGAAFRWSIPRPCSASWRRPVAARPGGGRRRPRAGAGVPGLARRPTVGAARVSSRNGSSSVAAAESVRRSEALGLIRPGAESRPETLVRLAIIEAGLPEPEVNVDIRDGAGTVHRSW